MSISLTRNNLEIRLEEQERRRVNNLQFSIEDAFDFVKRDVSKRPNANECLQRINRLEKDFFNFREQSRSSEACPNFPSKLRRTSLNQTPSLRGLVENVRDS